MACGGTDPVARAWPRAQKARERSSMHVVTRALGCMATASVRAEERDPAQVNTKLIFYWIRQLSFDANCLDTHHDKRLSRRRPTYTLTTWSEVLGTEQQGEMEHV